MIFIITIMSSIALLSLLEGNFHLINLFLNLPQCSYFDTRNPRNWLRSLFPLAARKLTVKSDTHLRALPWSLCSAFSLSTFFSLFSLILIFHFNCILSY